MDHFTVLPFLLAMFIAVAAMPTHVVDVHRQGMGIEHEQPWRSTALASMRARVLTWRTRLRAWLRHPAAMPAAAVLLLLLVAAVAPVPADGASLAAAAALPNVRQIRQDRADNESAIKACAAAQAKLKTEARGLFAVAADKRTPEQKDRLTAIDAQLDVLVAQDAELTATAATIATELQRAERYVEEERGSGSMSPIQVGVDHATERPWGREIPATASAKVQAAPFGLQILLRGFKVGLVLLQLLHVWNRGNHRQRGTLRRHWRHSDSQGQNQDSRGRDGERTLNRGAKPFEPALDAHSERHRRRPPWLRVLDAHAAPVHVHDIGRHSSDGDEHRHQERGQITAVLENFREYVVAHGESRLLAKKKAAGSGPGIPPYAVQTSKPAAF